MNELLSPAGTIDSFYAAISNGADAIYLGLDKFNARAYADNFTLDNLKELLVFAHLRNVKIFVTVNTLVYDSELEEVYKTIDELANMGIDGIIVQDLAIFNYITNNYKSLPAHCSTQMGIDDLEAATLAKEMGAKRIVFARETPLETIKEIKEKLNIEVEDFIHGALCVGYSGNCLMSSMMGERSGNRGRCAGCCRKLYSLVNIDTNSIIDTGYLMSMKDLNTSDYINKMKFIDSFKIEGRMKEPNYVASVTNYYRHIIDNEKVNKENLNKVFNRTYTKGFINDESSSDITNIEKPNNYGYYIGVVERKAQNKIFIRLEKPLNKGDQIRVESKNKFDEISIPVLRLYDSSFKVVNSMNKLAIVETDKKVDIGAKVYKTKDILFIEEANRSLVNKEYKKLDIDMEFNAELNKPIFLKVQYDKTKVFIKSDYIVEEATNNPTTIENVSNQLNKLNDTPYKIRNLDINMDDNLFIPLKLINELRRDAINKLNTLRSERKVIKNTPKELIVKKYCLEDPELTVEVSNEEQYQVTKELGIKHIYYKNIIRRNNAIYKDIDGEVLVGGLNGIHHYKDTNLLVSNYSLNVTNYKTIALLSSLGVDRITLSQELSKEEINNLVNNYYKEYNTYPKLELIVYGRTKLMHSKYCILKRLGKCGECKKHHYALKDEYASFPIIFNEDCTTTILNSKTLNLIDNIDEVNGINYFRLVFTDESKEETRKIIELSLDKIKNQMHINTFDNSKNTRGHFFKRPL